MDVLQQKQLFDIPDDICYLNTASLSPSFKAVGIVAVTKNIKLNPEDIVVLMQKHQC